MELTRKALLKLLRRVEIGFSGPEPSAASRRRRPGLHLAGRAAARRFRPGGA